MAFNLQTGWANPSNGDNLSNVLTVEVADPDVLRFAVVHKLFHCFPGCIDIVLDEYHFTIQIRPLWWICNGWQSMNSDESLEHVNKYNDRVSTTHIYPQKEQIP